MNRRTIAGIAASAAMLLTACGGAPSSTSGHRPIAGGTATFAEAVGSPPNYIFPLYSGADSGNNNITYLQPLMWRPLYWFGHRHSAEPTVNYALSLAQPPVWSNGGRTATITLKSYRWSNGQPVTSRDVQFWMNLLRANKSSWVTYAPGDWLDQITSLTYPSPSTFTITFTHAYSHAWLMGNALSEITPLPQKAWDKTSAAASPGNADLTPAGAHAVFTYLDAQSKSLVTWDTNPLWQVVDGPWRLQPQTGFDATTGAMTLIPNRRYAGPDRPHLSRVQELPFTSATAELDALMSGKVDYGYLPFTDLSLRSRLQHQGYRIRPWLDWGITFVMFTYPNRAAGPTLNQLYVRQALQHLVNQGQIIQRVFGGYATPTYGPIPVDPPNPYLSPTLRHNPFPYSPSTAAQMLRAHGWHVVPDGSSSCQRPGSGPGQCGPGIGRGAGLSFTVDYVAGVPAYTQEMEALQSSFAAVGIHLALRQSPFTYVLTQSYSCNAATGAGCTYPMLQWGSPSWTYVPVYYPTGGTVTVDTGLGGSHPPAFMAQINRLVQQTHMTSSAQALDQYQNALVQDAPYLWLPNAAYQISVISNHLHGVSVQDATGHIYPQDWYLTR